MRMGAPAGAWTPVGPGAAATTRETAIPATTTWVSTVLAPGVGVAPRPFHVLAKPTGAICNLDCEYCFFLSKEALYPGDRFRMADELLETYIRQLIEAHGDAPEVTIAWQGGEPTLMGVDFFRRAIELASEYARPGQRIEHTIQTNGTLLDDEWGELFARARLPRRHQHRRAARAARRVPRRQAAARPPSIGSCAASTCCKQHERRLERAVHRATPPTRITAARCTGSSATSSARRTSSSSRSSSATNDTGLPGGRHRHRPRRSRRTATGGSSSTSSTSGSAATSGRCSCRCSTPRSRPGSACRPVLVRLRRDLRQRGRARAQRRPLLLRPLRRAEAPARQHPRDAHGRARRLDRSSARSDRRSATRCRGSAASARCGSPATASARRTGSSATPDGEPGLNYLCASFLRFFGHVHAPMRTMGALLAAGRAPAEIMADYAAADARRGRNDLCTCASGQKWKNCHGA